MPRIALFLLAVALPSAVLAQAPTIPRAQFIVDMDNQFRQIDADKDGLLTRIEIEQFQKASIVAASQARNRAMFVALDTDRNGQISATEFLRLPINTPAANPATILRFDTTKDGKVSVIEHRTATLINFDRLDIDKDGNVNAAEMKAGGIGRQ